MSTLKVGALQGISASSDAITLANDGTCTANITNNLSNRNKVINGAMVINQRSGTYNRPTGDEYTVDRFETRTGSSFNFDTLTTQDSSAPDGFSKSLKITPQTTQTPTASHNGMIGTLLEADNLLGFASGTSSAKKFVLSFYAKSASQNNNHQYSVQLSKVNSGGQYYYQNRSFTVTSSWQRFTVVFPADTTNNIATGSGEGLRILWHLAAGSNDIASAVTSWTADGGNYAVTGQSNFMDNTSNEFYLTGVQLEASDSDVATDFEHLSFADELRRCQRYFYGHSGGNPTVNGSDSSTPNTVIGTCACQASTAISVSFVLPVPMRAVPTLYSTVTGSTRYRLNSYGANTNSGSNPVVYTAGSTHTLVQVDLAGFSGLVAGDAGTVRRYLGSGVLGFQAEL